MNPRYEPWCRAVWANSDASPSARAVLAVMGSACSPDGHVAISLAELERLTGQARNTVKAGVRELLARDEIAILDHAAGRKHPAFYAITIKRERRFGPVMKKIKGSIAKPLSVPVKGSIADPFLRRFTHARARSPQESPQICASVPLPNVTPFPTQEAAEA